ncbi:hypothetical protein [Mucisphaera sp.]|uniref:hypothetical protein n=1 Tax=Mucisphaera sp. TaxID=2913024 RepID=UPI003D0FA174
MRSTRSAITAALSLSALLAFTAAAEAQLRVVSYNTAGGPRTGLEDVLEAIGDENRNGFAKPIDVLALQEQNSPGSTTQAIVNLLNSVYGSGTYARANVSPGSTGAGGPGLIYNTQTVSLISEAALGTISSSGPARQFTRYQLRPVGYGEEADFYLYNHHYKASRGSTNEGRRLQEAIQVRNDADALGEGTSIIYAGDFNLYTAFEPAYAHLLTSPGAGIAFDPIDKRGNWSNNDNFRETHTQAPSSSPPGGLVGGGVDDRFDFQLVTGELLDTEGLDYIPGSYRAFGNDGSHTMNQSITTGTGASPTILTRLTQVSDHLPVVADYQLPAKPAFDVQLSDNRAIVGATVTATLQATNIAPVVAAIGADELDYDITVFNTDTASITGTAQALAGPTEHDTLADTSTPGTISIGGLLTSTNPNTDTTPIIGFQELTVLEPANPSFADGTDADTPNLDLGVILAGASDLNIPLHLYNNETTADFTASLDLDNILPSGSSTIMLNLSPFSGLEAGSAQPFSISMFVGNTADTRDTSFILNLSDEDIPGETNHQLSINVSATIAAFPGDINGSGNFDAGDIDTLAERFGTDAPGYDLNNDTLVNNDDIDFWLASLFGSVPGDANLDRTVDLIDLSLLASNFGSDATSWAEGNFNADSTVDLIDLSLLASNFGFDGNPIPEPATGIALLALAGLRPRRH